MKKILVVLFLAIAPKLHAQSFVFDPDKCITCRDSREHMAAGAAIDAFEQSINWPKHTWQRLAVFGAIATAYEFGQESSIRYQPDVRGTGYGFGVKDILVGFGGALVSEGLGVLLRKVF